MRKNIVFAALALAGLATLGFTPTRHDNSYTTNGVTYAQRGGLSSADYVVTNVDADAVGRIKSVNGKIGTVTLSASDVGALPSGTTHLSGDVPVTRTVNGKSLQYNITLNSADVGAVPRDANYNTVSNAAVNAVQEEEDPTVPSWAKEDSKPTYTAREVKAIPYDYVGDADIIHTTEFISFDNDVMFGNEATITISTNFLYFGGTKYTGVSTFPNDAGYLVDSSLAPITNALWTGYTPWRVYMDGVEVTEGAVQPHYRADLGKWEVGNEVYADGGENATTITWSNGGEYSAVRKAISFTKVSQLENDAGYISADTNRIVIGRNHETSADTDIICIGGTCKSTATNSTAIGFGAFAVGDYATAIGGSDANGLWNTSVGVNNQTFYGYSSAFGVENYIYGGFGTALGVLNHLYGNYAFSAGLQNTSTNVAFTTVLGYNNSIDSSSYTTIVGRGNKAETSSGGSTIVGGSNESKGNSSTIVGVGSKTYGLGSTAIGNMAEAFGQDALAIGQSVVASNTWAVAIGQSAIATNDNAIVIGSSGTFLDRPRSHGKNTINLGHSAVDETKVYIGDRQLADIIDSRAGDVDSVVATIPNNITRTASDATLVHCDSGNCTNALIYIRQATHSLAGLMTAADKTAFDGLVASAVTRQTVTNVVNEVKELHYDEVLNVTWETRIVGGEMKFFAVTNANISVLGN